MKDKNVGASCPITGRDLEVSDVNENSVQVRDKTVLFMPSFQSSMKLKQVSSPIDFTIIERVNLSSLSEGQAMHETLCTVSYIHLVHFHSVACKQLIYLMVLPYWKFGFFLVRCEEILHFCLSF